LADDASGLFVFERIHKGKAVEVLLNTSAKPVRYLRGIRGGGYKMLLEHGVERAESEFKIEPFGFAIVSRVVP
jgi:hypothetical protein